MEKEKAILLKINGELKEIGTPAAPGDIVQEISHDDGSGSEAWGSIKRLDYQLNKWTLGIAPGIYLYRVESLVNGHEGESFVGKLAIVK